MKKIIRRDQIQSQDENPANIHPLLWQIYQNRGIQKPDELEKGLEHLLPYNDLLNIDKAIALLYQSMQNQDHILIIGDFDADGATSTALAVSALTSFGAKKVSYLVPNRFEYGYGLTPEIVNVAKEL